MGHLRSQDPLDAAVASLAGRQQGNVTHAQLIALGLSKKAIVHRIRTGRLFRVFRGVYSVGRRPATPLERAAAAVLACGPGAALSHGSAMTHWGFWKRWEAPFEVITARDRRPRHILVHRTITLHRQDVTTHCGIRVTTAARTLFDMTPRLTDRQRAGAVKRALVSPWLTPHRLAELLTRHPHRPATRLLAPFAAIPNQEFRSGLEIDFCAFCKDWDLPIPLTNATVGGYLADAYFPAHRLIVELDSHDYHDNPVSFETDRDRDADTLRHGIATIRITPERLTATPAKEAHRLSQILEQRRNLGP